MPSVHLVMGPEKGGSTVLMNARGCHMRIEGLRNEPRILAHIVFCRCTLYAYTDPHTYVYKDITCIYVCSLYVYIYIHIHRSSVYTYIYVHILCIYKYYHYNTYYYIYLVICVHS